MDATYALQGSLDFTSYRSATSEIRATPFQLSLLGYFIPQAPFSPFLLAGIGWYFTRFGGPGAHSETHFRPHVGGGAELLLTDRLSIDASYRFLWSQVYRLSNWRRPFGSAFTDRGSMLTAALNYRF